MKKNTVYITIGLPASGKSTWAREMCDKNPGKIKLVSKDDLRDMLDNGRWSRENEKFVIETRDSLIMMALSHYKDVIVHDTNFGGHVAHIQALVGDMANVVVKDFTDVDVKTCIARDLKRQNSVGEKVIMDMYNRYLKPVPPVIEHDPNLPDAVISDLDGTLALFGNRNPYDRDFENDTLNPVVASIIEKEECVILVSGRQEKFRSQTVEFLTKNNITWDFLFMRETGDSRPDYEVKKEIYDNFINGRFNIKFVLDDRNAVVDFWRSEGLTCLQVAPGDF